MPRVKWLFLAILFAFTIGLAGVALRASWTDWPPLLQGYALLCLGVVLIGLPADVLVRRLRRLPIEVSGHSEPVELAPPNEFHTLIGDGKAAWWLRIPGNQSLRPMRHDWEIRIPGLAKPLDGLRILHLSDLHLHPGFSRRFYEALADQAATVETDLVLFTGDLMDDEDALKWAEPVLSRLKGQLGQFAILGNHDARFEIEKPTAALRAAGFKVIEGAWARRELADASIVLGGTSYPWGPMPDPEAMPEADLHLFLSHSPDNFYQLADWGMDLVLCGHTHGGQYRLPIIGPVLMPSRYSRRFDAGFFRKGRTLMHVSRGLAAQHPLRINCPPEFSRFVLRSAPARQQHPRQVAHEARATGQASRIESPIS